jgi:hypothetical protein
MRTRSSSSKSPPNSEPDDPVITAGSSNKVQEQASWSIEDVAKLLDFFMEKRAEMTESQMFKGPLFNDAAIEVNKSRVKGAPKTGKAVKSKWVRVCHRIVSVIAIHNLTSYDS